MTDFRPGTQVMVLRLPISIDAFGLLPEFTDRVYGTGAMMKLDRDQVSVAAPAEGFGPRVTEPLPEAVEDDSLTIRELTRTDLDDGGTGIEWTLEGAQASLGLFVESQIMMMDGLGATNYVVSDIAIGDGEPAFQVVVQRKDATALTPHEARVAAEQRETVLIEAVRSAMAALRDGDATTALDALLDAVPGED